MIIHLGMDLLSHKLSPTCARFTSDNPVQPTPYFPSVTSRNKGNDSCYEQGQWRDSQARWISKCGYDKQQFDRLKCLYFTCFLLREEIHLSTRILKDIAIYKIKEQAYDYLMNVPLFQ